jgi:sugar lactone lactonase YvrE
MFVVGSHDDAGWLLRSRLRGSVPGDLKPFLKVGERPTCAAISTRGWVVVGDAGKPSGSEDSRLIFHHPSDSTAETALSIKPGLQDISAIAYSPDGSLFVADSAESDPQRGGIYRIDMDYQDRTIGGKAVRVISVEHPTALSFAPDGTLYMIARDKELLRVIDIQ